jgi:hypothetical protein
VAETCSYTYSKIPVKIILVLFDVIYSNCIHISGVSVCDGYIVRLPEVHRRESGSCVALLL